MSVCMCVCVFVGVYVSSQCNLFEGLFAPTYESPSYFFLNFWISYGKVTERKWSQIKQFWLRNGLKSPREKKFILGFFFNYELSEL